MNELSQRRRKEIAALVHKKYRDQYGSFLIEGPRSVWSAIRAKAPLTEILLSDTYSGEEIEAYLLETDAVVHVLPTREIERMSDLHTSQGVLAVAALTTVPPESLTDAQTILALDGVQDPGNMGAILRTAAWFGLDAVLANNDCADFFNPKVVRATMGGIWDVRIARVQELTEPLALLKNEGFTCCGAALKGMPASGWSPMRPLVLVLGSEARGISEAVEDMIDEMVCVEGADSRSNRGVESLNVGVAAGILMHRMARASGSR